MARVFRIYTESSIAYDRNVRRIVGEYFDGFTEYSAVGHWRGSEELSRVVEIVVGGDEHDAALARGNVRLVAQRIKEENSQQAVMVMEAGIDVEFV